MPNPKLLLNGAKTFLSMNSPSILTGLGITSGIVTGVSSAKAAWDIRGELEGKDVTIVEIFSEGRWKKFILPVGACVSTIACFIGINTKYGRLLAAATSVVTLREQELVDTKSAMGKILKKGDIEKINQEKAQTILARNPQPDENLIIHTKYGNDLFFDEMSGRYFRSSMEHVVQGINNVNEMLNNGNFVSVNELYEEWGLPGIELGDILYMNPQSDPAYHLEILDIDHSQAHVTDKGEAAVILKWRNDLNSFLCLR